MFPRDPRRGSLIDLSDRIKLRLTGEDRFRFVNGQITNDVRKATDATAIAACILNAKGKLNAHVYISIRDNAIWMDADATLRDSLPARLERYVIADDVVIEDLTGRLSILHVIADAAPAGLAAISANRFGTSGFDVWMDSAKQQQLKTELSLFPICENSCSETFRIEQGIPAWGRELTEETIPIEANLEDSCIDYHKGCYIGQEVISRMKMSGQRNKSLCGFVSLTGDPIGTDMKLYPSSSENKECGWVTSATWSDRLGAHIALGYVKRPRNVVGTNVEGSPADLAHASPVAVKIVSLPFAAPSPVNG
jgi:folate-binding protein YgfZ